MAKKVYIQDIELTGGGSGGEVAWDDITGKPEFAGVATSGDYEDLENKPDLNTKQDALVSGENIKTINNESLLGPGNIDITGGGDFYVIEFGRTTYSEARDLMLADVRKPILFNLTGTYPAVINIAFDTPTPGVSPDIIIDTRTVATDNNVSTERFVLKPDDTWEGSIIEFEGGGAFVATYDQTSYADVKDAIDANKPIVVDFPNNKNLIMPTYCTYAVGGNITMYGIYKSANAINMSTITVTPSNAWAIAHDDIQQKLVSGENIKTVNNISLLGSGNIDIEGGAEVFVAEKNVTTYQEALDALGTYKLFVVKNGSIYMYANTMAVSTGVRFFTFDSTTPIQYEIAQDDTWSETPTLLQKELRSGESIKTLNNESLLGSGNIDIPLGDLTELTTEDQSNLVAALNEVYEKCGEPFRVKQWQSNTLNAEIPVCTEDISNTSIPKLTFAIDAEEGALYQIVGMIAYEIFDAESGGSRINCWPVCQFTGNGQKELGVRFMCAGTSRKTAKRISAWVLLKRRA